MLDDLREKLEQEADELMHELNVVLPREIERAVGLGDLRENSEYAAALERQRFVQARLDYLSRRLAEISEIDVAHIPTDRVGYGSRVTVRDLEGGEEEDFVLAFGDDVDFDNSEISMESPIGRALLGRQVGDTVDVALPVGGVRYEILRLLTIHELTADGEEAA